MTEMRHKLRVRMHDTDAAGILFFANQFLYMHDTYEEFLRTIGYPMEQLIGTEPFFVPIVHAEAQFTRQLGIGDELVMALKIDRVGNSSYTLEYELHTSEGELAGTGKTVHVSIGRDSRQKIELPQKFREALENYQSGA